ncbi:glycoside hydrolase family 99-like domain-containing protein [Pseudomonas sp. 18058]|uniref:glycoside hydrolase family 99-like domain-containing protein n=1 Tax=Pseudomonas sp. 18058 TaxID=2681406 RepID=UPI0013593252|nr:glycoside hydrolase family 99-like domain-containing protein [Pseudomonas sp. 18058]
MNELFSDLFVSSPNGGGLFFISEGKVTKLDGINTVGLGFSDDRLFRAVQPNQLWAFGENTLVIDDSVADIGDVHDVIALNGFFYVVGTTRNEVVKFDSNGCELRRWRMPGEDDSQHLNCLAVWNGKIVYSAFGEFSEHRGYKGNTHEQGFVKDLETGDLLIRGLSQPHSVLQHGQNLLIANSEMKELCEFSPEGVLLRSKNLEGYTRGICIKQDVIYVGLSRSRNIDALSLDTAVVLALDIDSWEELGRIIIPANEIYSIVTVEAGARLSSTLVSLFSQSTKFLANLANLAEKKLEAKASAYEALLGFKEKNDRYINFQMEVILSMQEYFRVERAQLFSAYQQTRVDHAQLLSAHQQSRVEVEKLLSANAKLNNQILELTSSRDLYQGMVDEIRASTSWRLTSPLRAIVTFKRKFIVVLGTLILRCYRALPVSQYRKQKLKNFAFKYFGFLFQRFGAYKTWKEFRKVDTHWLNPAPVSSESLNDNDNVIVSAELPRADGIWEWSDYHSVKQRIAGEKRKFMEERRIEPVELITLGSSTLASTATRLEFPELVENPKISIIIPVFNNLAFTLECLSSIAKYSGSKVSYEIIVADDASVDDTPQVLELIKNIRYVRNDINLGFLRNCNNALELVKGEFTLFLNNDVQVTKDWLETLLSTFADYPNVGAVGPKFVYPSGHLQEAGAALMSDGSSVMVGLNQDASLPKYNYIRRVDYVSGACLLLPTSVLKEIGGFSEEFLPCYCEDSDLCLSVRAKGYDVYYNPLATIVHHLSKTTDSVSEEFKLSCITNNVNTLQKKWGPTLEQHSTPRIISFYLPQFHPMAENDQWWGKGFTEWTNVSKARPNFEGHYQPRLPADIGYYDLRLLEVMEQQAELAREYGLHGFCFYYYWFDGKRLLERPVEQLLENKSADVPFCLCWANENWTRRWDGQENEVLMAQAHSEADDKAVINDLIRFFRDERYIKIDGRPLILVYRVTLFPNFAETAARWREVCREQGIGEIYIAMVESFELVSAGTPPAQFGCDSAVEFPPQGLAEQKKPSGKMLNPDFKGSTADYRDLAVRYASRQAPGYTRFKGVMPGWDNTARRQDNSFCFENATPGAFQAWLEDALEETRNQNFGDEQIVFVNAWNEWAEGAYLEPDRRYGHTYLEAVKNATDASLLLKK